MADHFPATVSHSALLERSSGTDKTAKKGAVGNSPGYTNRLWHLQCSRQGLPVHLVDLVDAQAGANKDQGGMEHLAIWPGHFHEAVLVHVGEITCRVDAE